MVWMPRLFLPPYAKLYLRAPSASLLREANQFHPYETRVSPLWNWSFTPMELQFHPYGTRVSPLWNCSANPL